LEADLGQTFEWQSNDDGTGSALATFDFDHISQTGKEDVYTKIGDLLTRITDQLKKKSQEFDEKR
jgi:hypothetical protein